MAIMKKEWGFIEKILSGQKSIESRWYRNKYKPLDSIKKGETIYFKDSGHMVAAKAEVQNVIQFVNLNVVGVKKIISEYGKDIGLGSANFLHNKKYCILIFLKNPQRIRPFKINKKGFGSMASWIVVNNIEDIKI